VLRLKVLQENSPPVLLNLVTGHLHTLATVVAQRKVPLHAALLLRGYVTGEYSNAKLRNLVAHEAAQRRRLVRPGIRGDLSRNHKCQKDGADREIAADRSPDTLVAKASHDPVHLPGFAGMPLGLFAVHYGFTSSSRGRPKPCEQREIREIPPVPRPASTRILAERPFLVCELPNKPEKTAQMSSCGC
jgi:hypothetical protein